MNIEEKLKSCKFNLMQINHYDPDSYYVGYFFKEYLQAVIDIYDEIFEEANQDFGLFVSGKGTQEKFEQKAIEKKDDIALKFSFWFKENYENEHKGAIPNLIKKTICFLKENNRLPKITIRLCSAQRYKDDIFQLVGVGLTDGKIRSKEELQTEIKRQTPLFLEMINQKRKINNEPIVSKNQVKSSTFLGIKNYEDIEISQACEIYLPVMKRILEDFRAKIKELTT